MKVTTRQLKVQDTLGEFGVVAIPENLQRATGVVVIGLITQRGMRFEQAYGANAVLDIKRPGVDEDETNNPYWWGMEAEAEAAEDRRAYEHDMMLESMGIFV